MEILGAGFICALLSIAAVLAYRRLVKEYTEECDKET